MVEKPPCACCDTSSRKSLLNGEEPRQTITQHSNGVCCILASIWRVIWNYHRKFGSGVEVQSCMVCRTADGGIIMTVRKNIKVLQKYENSRRLVRTVDVVQLLPVDTK